ncbi:MAG TPA: serine/threonine-protein kinase [Polyangiales bacterium]|nr:serine/threonine-protein kinase [Polyangiales bacterium]
MQLEGTLLDGRYRLGAALGSGGMSVVFEAEDLRLLRTVAIKVIRGTSSSTLVERLFREAKAAARADHPAVITVYGYGSDQTSGLDYLVLERLRGSDLATRILEAGPLPIELVVRVGIETADALAAVHDAGVVHRDLKPANIFLARRGKRIDEVKLLDFGTAKHIDMQTLTTPGQVLGTLAYMPPEQMRDSKHVDTRVDIYALGVTLYECLAGKLPFVRGSGAELAAAMILGVAEITPVRQLRGEVSHALAAIVERCMQRKPSDRFPSARALGSALTALSPANP